MKLVFRQFLSSLVVVLVLIVSMGAFFVGFTKQVAYTNTWNHLEGYADSLKKQALVTRKVNGQQQLGINIDRLHSSEELLSSQDVRVVIFTAPNKVVYPEHGYQARISANDWAKLKAGKTLREKLDEPAQLFAGHKKSVYSKDTTDIFSPCFDSNGNMVAVISIGATISSMKKTMRGTYEILGLSTLLAVLLTLFISYALAHYMTKRTLRLKQAVEEVAQGDYGQTIPVNTHDELGQLTNSFNRMSTSLKESAAKIDRQNRMQRQFFSNAAHEMRTPLTTINGLIEGLMYDAIPADSRMKSLELMRNETERLIRIVNNNLDYEKIRTGQIALNLKEFDAAPVLRQLQEQLREKAEDQKDILALHVPVKLMVYADHDRFIQIVINIMQNAIQFTKDGTITVTAHADTDNNQVIIKIADTGIGMSAEEQEGIWDRYYKADPSRKNTKYGESGLGLSIVRQLVHLHHGTITVESAPNEGSTFTVTLPAKPEN